MHIPCVCVDYVCVYVHIYTVRVCIILYVPSRHLHLCITILPSLHLYITILRTIYMESMGKTLLNLFRSYCSQLLKLELLMAGKNDLIAVEEATLKSVFTQKVRRIENL